MAVEVISTRASVGCSMTGSGTSSTRTSSVPCHVTARTGAPVSVVPCRSSADAIAQLALVEAEEAVLVRADLCDGHLVEAGVGEALERLHVPVRVGAARRALRGLLDADLGRRLLEVGGGRQVLVELPRHAARGPKLVDQLAGGLLVLVPA